MHKNPKLSPTSNLKNHKKIHRCFRKIPQGFPFINSISCIAFSTLFKLNIIISSTFGTLQYENFSNMLKKKPIYPITRAVALDCVIALAWHGLGMGNFNHLSVWLPPNQTKPGTLIKEKNHWKSIEAYNDTQRATATAATTTAIGAHLELKKRDCKHTLRTLFPFSGCVKAK